MGRAWRGGYMVSACGKRTGEGLYGQCVRIKISRLHTHTHPL